MGYIFRRTIAQPSHVCLRVRTILPFHVPADTETINVVYPSHTHCAILTFNMNHLQTRINITIKGTECYNSKYTESKRRLQKHKCRQLMYILKTSGLMIQCWRAMGTLLSLHYAQV